MPVGRAPGFAAALFGLAAATLLVRSPGLTAAPALQAPDQFIGFKVGSDNKLARWDKIVEYLKLAGSSSDRVHYRELGKTTLGNSLVALEIASPETLKNLDRYKQLERRLYFQGGAPNARDRDEMFRLGKAVVLITCATHATEIGCTQASLELVHTLATDDSAVTRKILDNVIVLLVPSLNPDGQTMVTDWFNKNAGTPYETSPIPYLYHPYVGHDSNRDMYMFTQKESQYMAQLVWHDWFPTIWLDQHQMSANGARIFVMPATDPINPNVHPVIYRWNAILGQSQAAALETAGKDGIIHNSTYTNFWQGAMAWSGWWHNQIGLLTEVASVRIAAPVDQQRATSRLSFPLDRVSGDGPEPVFNTAPLAPPTDTVPRTEYPRPWMGGHWTLRDIVDYELITTTALLETAADRRETILRQIYEVNRQTIEDGKTGDVKAIVIPLDRQHDPREADHLAERLMMGGVEVFRTDAPFSVNDYPYPTGTLVVPMTQVFARYAKDLLEPQDYPDMRRVSGNPSSPDLPYDVTAWSLGMLLGVNVDFVTATLPPVRMTRVDDGHATGGAGVGQRPAVYVPVRRAGHRDCDQSTAERRREAVLRRAVARAGRGLDPRQARTARPRVRHHDGVHRAGAGRRHPGTAAGDPLAAHRAVLPLDRRQHRRRVDALGARTIRVPGARRFTTATCATAARCGGGSTRSSCPTRTRVNCSTATRPIPSARNIAAGSATPAWTA